MREMVAISPEMDAKTFARFAELMEPIIERSQGRTTLAKIVEDHKLGLIQIWAVHEPGLGISSIGITRLLRYPSGLRVMRIDHGAGELEDGIEFIEQLESYARAVGADKMRIEGRAGWQRVFPDWHEVSRIIEKEL